jgi:hypothetical protein
LVVVVTELLPKFAVEAEQHQVLRQLNPQVAAVVERTTPGYLQV